MTKRHFLIFCGRRAVVVSRSGRITGLALVVALGLSVLTAGSAHAKAHLWRISEVFSNADGTIQFIELEECCGSVDEILLTNADLASDENLYEFPNDLDFLPGTAFAWVLMATESFAALPGAPTPDYIIPEQFFDPDGDTLSYTGLVDVFSFGPGELPTDGRHSLQRDVGSGVVTVGINSPRNYPGDVGSVFPVAAVSTGHPAIVLGLVSLAAGGATAALRRTT